MSKHTREPWKLKNGKIFAAGKWIAEILMVGFRSVGDKLEAEANGRLIVAAPEMLEMLRLASWPVCRRTGYEDCGLCDTCRARALIAKIEEV